MHACMSACIHVYMYKSYYESTFREATKNAIWQFLVARSDRVTGGQPILAARSDRAIGGQGVPTTETPWCMYTCVHVYV